MTDISTRLLSTWRKLAPLPGGKWLFSRIVGWIAPYTGSIGARIESLEPGHVVASLRDRRAVRQHLGSVHAVALVNLAEVTSGLATLTAAGPGIRGIVTALQITYHKKARGRLCAESRVTLPSIVQPTNVDVTAEITDPTGDLVAIATMTWRLAPT